MPYDVEAIRKKIKASMSGSRRDPDEFRPDKGKPNETLNYRFYILPPINLGEMIGGGKTKAKKAMEQFFIHHGNHWVADKPHACPRCYDNQKCPICDFGFGLLKDPKVKEDQAKKDSIRQTWMPTESHMMNIYFANDKVNPEDLRGRVMFYNAPRTVIDFCTTCLMREDAGDPENPQAWGVFFDESAAFPFQLEVTKSGRNNSYKTSKFLANARPLVKKADGTADTAAITKILEARHDLFAKIEVPDPAKIDRLYAVMLNGDDSGDDKKPGGFDSDETKGAVSESAPAGKKDPGVGVVTQSTKAKAAPAKPPVDDDDDVVPMNKPKPAPAKAAAPVAKPKPAPKPVEEEEPLAAETPLDDDEGGTSSNRPEIDNLLGQLEDDD